MPFVANEIFLCELAAISSKFFTPEIAEKIELVDYAMTPDSSMKVSNDSLLFPSVKQVDQKKPDLVISFNDDCEVELLDPVLSTFNREEINTDQVEDFEQFAVNDEIVEPSTYKTFKAL